MTKRNGDGYLAEIQERMDGDVFKAMLEVVAQRVMEEELARHLGADRHERTEDRRGHRNGYKPRGLKTRVGELALRVPQARGMEPYSPLLFAKWERSERALLVACAEMYFMGVSTRKAKKVLEKMGGFELSASTVSCVAQELDETIAAFRQRRLDDHTWPYVMVDATYVKVRKKPCRQPGRAGGGGDQRRRPARNLHLASRFPGVVFHARIGAESENGLRTASGVVSEKRFSPIARFDDWHKCCVSEVCTIRGDGVRRAHLGLTA